MITVVKYILNPFPIFNHYIDDFHVITINILYSSYYSFDYYMYYNIHIIINTNIYYEIIVFNF